MIVVPLTFSVKQIFVFKFFLTTSLQHASDNAIVVLFIAED